MAMKIWVRPRRLKIRRLHWKPPRLANFVYRLFSLVRGKASYANPVAPIPANFGPKALPRTENRTHARPAKPNLFSVAGRNHRKKGIYGRGKVVPEGFVAVYVGEEQRRFVIPIGYLSHPFVTALLMEAENVFGFDHTGPLTFPCDVNDFEQLQWLIEQENLRIR